MFVGVPVMLGWNVVVGPKVVVGEWVVDGPKVRVGPPVSVEGWNVLDGCIYLCLFREIEEFLVWRGVRRRRNQKN